MVIKAKKAIKINSQRGDGHINGEELLVIGKTPALQGIRLYIVLTKKFPLPVMILDTKIEIEEILTEEITLDEAQVKYIDDIPKGLITLFK